jgi:GNAT superfamily N-acetyltransferase
MIVRRATRSDVPELARVHTESAVAAHAHVGPPEIGGRERRTANWTRVFDEAIGTPHLAELDGAVVGILNFGPARDEAGTGELYVLYVVPGHWGLGTGQLLLDKAHDELGSAFDEAILNVLADNPRARRFYERNGWLLDEIRVEPQFGDAPTEIARYRRRFDRQPSAS